VSHRGVAWRLAARLTLGYKVFRLRVCGPIRLREPRAIPHTSFMASPTPFGAPMMFSGVHPDQNLYPMRKGMVTFLRSGRCIHQGGRAGA
jgi:hypothetical protein